jgi:signal peptidase I
MKKNTYNSPPFSCLTLADGQKFLLRPTDCLTAEIVARITNVMHLSPGIDGCEIFVCVTEKNLQEGIPTATRPLVCCLSPGSDEILKAIQMSQLARFIAAQTIPRGGMLIHGGLVMHQERGIILAAPGGTGKSTACRRLPESWEVLSDDATLVVQTNDGSYFAHPWPTWSRFFDEGPGGTWNVEQAVPLSAIFFLRQSPVDKVEPLSRANATVFIMESIRQALLLLPMAEHHPDRKDELLNIYLSAAERLVNSVQIHVLQISLSGTFWEEITKTLQNPDESFCLSPRLFSSLPLDTTCRVFDDNRIPIIYSGPSMNPTFRDADLLAVVPNGTRQYRVGDIICFYSPEKNRYIIHRIVAIQEKGFQTRGDNNPAPDPELVQPDEIIGKVVQVSRASGTQRVPGGITGIILHILLLKRKLFLEKTDSLIRTKNPIGFGVHLIRYCFSPFMKPRYILFSTRYSCYLRLYIGSHMAGDYNTIRKAWKIRSPFSIFFDKRSLPIVDQTSLIYEMPGRL